MIFLPILNFFKFHVKGKGPMDTLNKLESFGPVVRKMDVQNAYSFP